MIVLLILFKLYFKLFPKRVLLGLHSVGNNAMPASKLAELCLILKKLGFKFEPSVFELMQNEKSKNSVHLTFDDGYIDNFTNAYPVLSEMNITATIFIVPGFILEKTAPNSNGLSDIKPLSKENIFQLISAKWNFGFHTNSHIDLYSNVFDEIKNDFVEGVNNFNSITCNNFVNSLVFAYPFGYLPIEKYKFEKVLEKFNVKYAITTRWGNIDSKKHSRYYLNRVMIGDNDRIFWIMLKISGLLNGYNKLKWSGEKYE